VKVIILGSGIIGVSSAYELARQGHQVTVIDRQPAAAMETSFANAGQISPGYAAPWAAPGIPLKALKWIFSQHSPLVINPRPEWDKFKFMAAMLKNCTTPAYAQNKGRMLRLAEYSRQVMQQTQQDLALKFDAQSLGTLQLFRSAKQLHQADKDCALLTQYGIPHQRLDRAECLAVEPGLHRSADKLLGGLRLPLDQTGDCHQFGLSLQKHCETLGVRFQFNTQILSLQQQGKCIQGVLTDKGLLTADRYLMALGSYSKALLKPLAVDLPVYPVKGYSITASVRDPQTAPLSTIMDETYKVALTRLGTRIRVAGTAELNGYDLSLPEPRRATVHHVLNDLFPGGADLSEDSFWTGLRPMTPDGTPIIGRTAVENLFLNTGHGTLGWTMSLGSARLVADLLSECVPDIEYEDLALTRYGPNAAPQRGSAFAAT